MLRLPLVVIALLWTCGALATSYGPPEKRTVHSPTEKAVLRINPKTQIHAVYVSSRAVLPAWKFKREVWHHDYVVSDDARFVFWIAWPHTHVQALDDPALEIYDRSGKIATYTVRQLSKTRRYQKGEVGPIGSGRRIWRENFVVKDNTLIITMPGAAEVTWSLKTGERIH